MEWIKSSLTASRDKCVEVAPVGSVHVRDSKDPDGPRLTFDREAWSGFVGSIRAGELTRER